MTEENDIVGEEENDIVGEEKNDFVQENKNVAEETISSVNRKKNFVEDKIGYTPLSYSGKTNS